MTDVQELEVIGFVRKCNNRKVPPQVAIVDWKKHQDGWRLDELFKPPAFAVANSLNHLLSDLARHRPDVVKHHWASVKRQVDKVEKALAKASAQEEKLENLAFDTEEEAEAK
jgi:hypothetical protein